MPPDIDSEHLCCVFVHCVVCLCIVCDPCTPCCVFCYVYTSVRVISHLISVRHALSLEPDYLRLSS